MLNNALLAKSSDFNDFTEALRDKCLASKDGTILVRMRNNQWTEVQFFPGGEPNDYPYDSFGSPRSQDNNYFWKANGQSITSRDFDLVEFADEREDNMTTKPYKTYYETLCNMSEEVREIALKYWDETGRPVHQEPFICANIDLLNLSNDFNDFKAKFEDLFRDEVDSFATQEQMKLIWLTYMAGIKRCANDLVSKGK